MPSKAVTEKKDNLPAAIDFEDDAGKGIEGADNDSYAIPLLKVLQKVSPQCDPDNGAYMEEAKPGDFYNTITNELYSGSKGVTVIPCYFKHTFIEWVPRDAGGGFVAEHNPTSPDIADRRRVPNKSIEKLPNGNDIEDTRGHYCLLVKEDGLTETVLLPLTSTQIPVSKKWLTRIGAIRKPKKSGGMFNPSSYSHMYKLTTVVKSNEKGSWRLLEVNMLGEVTDPNLYIEAKAFYDNIVSGAIRAQHDTPTESAPVDDDAPF